VKLPQPSIVAGGEIRVVRELAVKGAERGVGLVERRQQLIQTGGKGAGDTHDHRPTYHGRRVVRIAN